MRHLLYYKDVIVFGSAAFLCKEILGIPYDPDKEGYVIVCQLFGGPKVVHLGHLCRAKKDIIRTPHRQKIKLTSKGSGISKGGSSDNIHMQFALLQYATHTHTPSAQYTGTRKPLFFQKPNVEQISLT